MVRSKNHLILALLASLSLFVSEGGISASDSLLRKQSTWNWPENQQIVTRLDQFLETFAARMNVAPIKAKLVDLTSLRGIELLESTVRLASECDSGIAKLLDCLKGDVTSASMENIDAALSSVMGNGGLPNWLKADVQLVLCRALVQNSLYDEAIQKLKQVPIDQVSDPSSYLFYSAICQHHLLQRDECLENLSRLLERELELPSRYAITARLMEADIKPLKEDSLDEISRLMNDVERRLALGRAGKNVRDKQQTIIDKLDKSIDELEQKIQQMQQMKNQQQQKQNGGKQPKPASGPMEESNLVEKKGPGEVDPKDIGKSSGWGNLPPSQRKEALQDMTKDLPSHLRDVVEAYFKKLSTSPSDSQ